MTWFNYILEELVKIGIVSILASAIATILVNRRNERDRAKTSRQLFVHQIQFEKEFQIYLDLWKEALAFGRAASEFRQVLKLNSGKSREEEQQEFIQARKLFNRRVYDYRPFYSPEVYDLAKSLLKKGTDVFHRQGVPRKSDAMEETIETLLDEINEMVNPLCDAIRSRIWVEWPKLCGR